MRVGIAIAMAMAAGGCSFSGPEHGAPGATDTPDAAITPDAPADAPPALTCPEAYNSKHGGHSYRLTGPSLTWTEARDDCATDGGHLVKIESQAEDDYLTTHIDGLVYPYVWIGLRDRSLSDTYVWADDSALTGFERWFSG